MQHNIKGKKKYFYKGILFQYYGNAGSTVEVPSHCSAKEVNGVFQLKVPKVEVCNGQQIFVIVSLHLANGNVNMQVNGKEINILKMGMHTEAELTQSWLDGMIKICERLQLCHGINTNNDNIRKRKKETTWAIVHPQEGHISEVNYHSENCAIILPMTHNYENKTCCFCARMERYILYFFLTFTLYMSHFAYACKMRYPLNLVLESWEYLWFY